MRHSHILFILILILTFGCGQANSEVFLQQPSGQLTVKTSFAATVASAEAVNKTVVVTGNTAITGTITIPSTVGVRVENGGYFSGTGSLVFSGGPVEFNGYVFRNSGTVTGLKEGRPEWWGAYADGTNPSITTNAVNAAVSSSKTIKFSVGIYCVNNTIREPTNGGARSIVGENMRNTIIKADASMFNKPIFWFGNSNGHGNYYGRVTNLTVDGNNMGNNNIGIRWHEAGTSNIDNVYIMNCGIGIQAIGAIGAKVSDSIIITCGQGIDFNYVASGIPSSPDDITKTASPLTLNCNMSKIVNVWFSNCDRSALSIRGGQILIEGCTFQSAVTGGAAYDVLSINSSNESYDYGGGPTVRDCWFEGGSYRYAIAIRNTRQARIEGNFISGDNNNSKSEGGILVSGSKNCIVKCNSIRGYFSRPPSESRIANGGIYVSADSQYHIVEGNYLTLASCGYYYEGEAGPTLPKGTENAAFAFVTVSGTTPTIVNSRHISTVTQLNGGAGGGMYRVNMSANRVSNLAPILITVQSSTPIFSTYINNGTIGWDIYFFDKDGVAANPAAFSIVSYADILQ